MKFAMKPALSTALSVAGVIAAGVAAFTVNSSVLGGASSPVASSDTTMATFAESSSQGPTRKTNLGSSGQESETSSLAQATATPVSDTTTTYQVGSAGSVVIDTSSGSIRVVSVMPAAGWAAEVPSSPGDGSVKLHFRNAAQRLEFVARMVGGQVNVNVTSDSVAPPAPPYRDDDDDRDERDDEDHEDEEHHDDDEEHHDEDDEHREEEDDD